MPNTAPTFALDYEYMQRLINRLVAFAVTEGMAMPRRMF